MTWTLPAFCGSFWHNWPTDFGPVAALGAPSLRKFDLQPAMSFRGHRIVQQIRPNARVFQWTCRLKSGETAEICWNPLRQQRYPNFWQLNVGSVDSSKQIQTRSHVAGKTHRFQFLHSWCSHCFTSSTNEQKYARKIWKDLNPTFSDVPILGSVGSFLK